MVGPRRAEGPGGAHDPEELDEATGLRRCRPRHGGGATARRPSRRVCSTTGAKDGSGTKGNGFPGQGHDGGQFPVPSPGSSPRNSATITSSCRCGLTPLMPRCSMPWVSCAATVTAGGVNLVLGPVRRCGPGLLASVPDGFHDHPTIEGVDGTTAPGTQRPWVWVHGTGDVAFDAPGRRRPSPVATVVGWPSLPRYKDSRDHGLVDGTPTRWRRPPMVLVPLGHPARAAVRDRPTVIHDLGAFQAVGGGSGACSGAASPTVRWTTTPSRPTPTSPGSRPTSTARRPRSPASTPYGKFRRTRPVLPSLAELRRFEIMLHNMFGLGDGLVTAHRLHLPQTGFFSPRRWPVINELLD